MNIQTLKTELALAKYSAMTDAEAVASLNAATISGFKKVDYTDVASYLTYLEKYLAIAESTAPEAKAFMMSAKTFKSIDMGKPLVAVTVDKQLDGLVTLGLITLSEKETIVSMANKVSSRAKQLSLGLVEEGHVIKARAL